MCKFQTKRISLPGVEKSDATINMSICAYYTSTGADVSVFYLNAISFLKRNQNVHDVIPGNIWKRFFVMLLEQIDYDGNNTVGMVVQMGI